jgi:hypothetical protein
MTTYAKSFCMKPIAGWLLLVFLGTGQLHAQKPASSLLWEISGNGLTKPSYLFGTFHMMCKGDFVITEALEKRIKATKQFYGELNMDDPQMQTKLMAKMMMQGKTLQSMFSETDYKKVSASFQTITGFPLLAFDGFKPFFALSVLALKSITCSETVQPETEFVAVAKKNQLPILGLETIDDQMDAIDKEPLDSQVNSLAKTVINFDSVKNEMVRMSIVYKSRDIDSLYAFMKSTGMDGNIQRDLLNNRNQKWAPLISSIIKKDPSFFAVGAGHLGGPEGVISLLRKQGYTLKPLFF